MDAIKPYREKKPWGDYEKFTENQKSTVKILTVDPHQAFSLQTHQNRSEYWFVLSGSGVATVGEEKREIKQGDEIFFPAGTAHRLEASAETLKVLEISLGEFDEADITRLEDRYGRK
jgi:mannose-6-phosphate isomerase-like protein (cupin superfamily)